MTTDTEVKQELDEWPPKWWSAVADLLGPHEGHKFLNGCIPLMDTAQFVYESLKAVAELFPHHPPEYKRPVYGIKGAGGGARVPIDIGEVGYNAVTRKVIWNVNRRGGPSAGNMTLDVQSVIPTVFQLIQMIPWDWRGELESWMGESWREGMDQAPKAGDIVNLCLGSLRQVASGFDLYIEDSNSMPQASALIPKYTSPVTQADIAIPGLPEGAQPHKIIVSGYYHVTIPPAEEGDEPVVERRYGRREYYLDQAAGKTVNVLPADVAGGASLTARSVDMEADLVLAGNPLPFNITFEPSPATPYDIIRIEDLRVYATAINVQGEHNVRHTQITVRMVSERSSELMIIPNLAAAAMNTVPLANFFQLTYEAAMALVESVSHHPPDLERPVIVDGVTVRYRYTVSSPDDGPAGKRFQVFNELPPVSALRGSLLNVTAEYYDGDGRPVGNQTLISHAFDPERFIYETEVSVPALKGGAFDGIPVYPVNPAKTQESNAALKMKRADDAAKLAEEESKTPRNEVEILRLRSRISAFDIAIAYTDTLLKGTADAVMKHPIREPEGIGINARSSLLAFEPGFSPTDPSITPVYDEIKDLVSPKARVAVDLAEGVRVPLSPPIVPPVSAIIMTGVIAQNVLAHAEDAFTLPITKPAVVRVTKAPSKARSWLGAELNAVLTGGALPDGGSPGDSPGIPVTLAVTLFNDSAQDQDTTEEGYAAEDDGTYNGIEITVNSVKFNVAFPLEAWGGLGVVAGKATPITLNMLSKNTFTVNYHPLSSAEIAFSAPIGKFNKFARYYPQEEMQYIGAELNLDFAFKTESIFQASKRRFLNARLSYGRLDSTRWDGTPVESKKRERIYSHTSGLCKETPRGRFNAVTIRYNADRRVVTVINNRNKEKVEMNTNSVPFFALSLLMLLPTEVV